MTSFGDLLRTLAAGKVNFIVVDGVAAAAHGSPRSTLDVDVVYSRDGWLKARSGDASCIAENLQVIETKEALIGRRCKLHRRPG